MSVAPEDRKPPRPQLVCCSCWYVVPGVAWVAYGQGLDLVGPERLCAKCVAWLRARERNGAHCLGEVVWDVRILELVGEFEEVTA